MHLFSREHLCASSGIVGASGPLASGFALASQLLRPGKLAVAFFGEGAMNQGMLLESLNLAAAWKLPVIFVCKDNGLAITTNSSSVTAGSLMERVKGFGLLALEADGTDIEAVWQAAAEAMQRARKGEGPVFLLAHCCHLEGHFLGDPLLRIIRSPFKQMKKTLMPLIRSLLSLKGASLSGRLNSLREGASLIWQASKEKKSKYSDPIYRTRQKLEKDKSRLEEMEKGVKQEIDRAVELSLAGFGSDSSGYNWSSNLS
jgi:pyruvate dehydrogenase E1 component alpha subunit